MAEKNIKFEEFTELIKKLSDAKAKLSKLKERKNTVRDAVYEKVKVDYEEKVKGVEKEMEEKGGSIDEVFSSCHSEIESLVNQRSSIEEEVEELSLRHYLGEFDEKEYERLYQEKKDLLGNLMKELEDATRKLDFLREFVPESAPETEPEGTVVKSDAEPVIKSIEPPGLHVQSVASGTSEMPPESAAPIGESKEVVEATVPEEPPAEEAPVATGEFPIEGEAAGIEEKAVEQPAEMLSEEEADKLIEEKIYPAEETTDIIKQPELAPDAREKKGVECPKCGMTNEPDSWYCEKCGTELLAEGAG